MTLTEEAKLHVFRRQVRELEREMDTVSKTRDELGERLRVLTAKHLDMKAKVGVLEAKGIDSAPLSKGDEKIVDRLVNLAERYISDGYDGAPTSTADDQAAEIVRTLTLMGNTRLWPIAKAHMLVQFRDEYRMLEGDYSFIARVERAMKEA